MKKYELLLVLPGTLDDKEAAAKLGEVESLVKEYSTDLEVHVLGKNRLAYPVKQIRYGYFYTMVFQAEAPQVKILEDKLRLMRDLLRAMISHFNITLTAAQKTGYSTEEANIAAVTREPSMVVAAAPVSMEEKVSKLVAPTEAHEEAPATVPSNVERKVEKLDIDSITKKLDDIMKGDVIPGI